MHVVVRTQIEKISSFFFWRLDGFEVAYAGSLEYFTVHVLLCREGEKFLYVVFKY